MKNRIYFKITLVASTMLFLGIISSFSTKEVVKTSLDYPYRYVAMIKEEELNYRPKEEVIIEEEQKEEIEEESEIEITEEKETEMKVEVKEEKEKQEQEETPKEEVLETFQGIITGYGPDCVGCSGRTASGYNVRNNIYYEDEEYGVIRIVAADRMYPFGSIVKINDCASIGEDIYAIVLDRGSAIGRDKRAQFDLLFENESVTSSFGLCNATFEIVRLGY